MKRFFKTFLLIIVLLPNSSFAYEPTQTHAGLTEQIVEFYNLQSSNKISNEQKELIIKGAIDEDIPASRALNHFYDPIRNIGINDYRSAKDWALIDSEANKYTWGETIQYYAEGNESEAFIGLGHIVHLIEDMGVPDHTRNDQHLPIADSLGGGSPYEGWAMQNKNRDTLRGLGKQYADAGNITRVFDDLGTYFDFLAKYSNGNFFSKDTIFRQDVYPNPKILNYDSEYSYGKDLFTGDIVKLVKRNEREEVLKIILSDDNDTSILSSYFDRLARQIIPSGAGVVELFFKEGEKARAIYQAELRRKQEEEARANAELAQRLSQKGFTGFLVNLWSGAVYLVVDYVVQPAKQIASAVGGPIVYGARLAFQEGINGVSFIGFTGKTATVVGVQKVGQAAVSTVVWTGEQLADAKIFIQKAIENKITYKPPSELTTEPAALIVVSTSISPASSENSTIRETPRLVFIGNLSPVLRGGGGVALLKQVLGTSETAVPAPGEITATTTMKIVESVGAALAAPTLSVPQCTFSLATSGCLLATTTVRFEWLPVTGTDHYSISRNGEYATTTEIYLDVIVPDFSDYTLEVAAVDKLWISSATSTKTLSVATIPIAINEIAWMGTTASSTAEWIELKNNTDYAIDLSQWALDAKDGTSYIKLIGTIKPREYLVFERTDNSTIIDVVAHAIYTSTLDTAGDQLTLSYAGTMLDSTPDGVWVAGENTSPTTRKTMERYASKKPGIDLANWGTWGSEIDIKNGTDAEGNFINGTPGARNSTTYLLNNGLDIESYLILRADEEYYLITRPITVTASSTFTLQPGVVIKFLDDGTSWEGPTLVILGVLHATGNAENPVVFESYLNNRLGEIKFIGGISTSTLDHVIVESIAGIQLTDGARLSVKNSEFINNYRGLEMFGERDIINRKTVITKEGGTLFVENTSFASTTKEAIAAYYGSIVLISSSTIRNTLDTDAIGVYYSTFTMVSSTIDGVNRSSGVYASNSTISIASSTISNILDGEGLVLDFSTSTITNVAIENSKWDGISIFNGNATIVFSDISNITEGNGINAYQATISIASSTVRNILDNDGIYLKNSTSTITNTVVDTVASTWGNGIDIEGGTASITSSTISGFTQGAGIYVLNPITQVIITDTDVTWNADGIIANPASSVVVTP